MFSKIAIINLGDGNHTRGIWREHIQATQEIVFILHSKSPPRGKGRARGMQHCFKFSVQLEPNNGEGGFDYSVCNMCLH